MKIYDAADRRKEIEAEIRELQGKIDELEAKRMRSEAEKRILI